MKDQAAEPKEPRTEQLLRRLAAVGKRSASAEIEQLLWDCADALRRETDKSQRILDSVDTVVVGLDRQGRITLVNQRLCELLGYQERELLGRSWFSRFLPQPEGMDIVYPVFQRIMAGRLAVADYFENEIRTRSGKRRMIAWRNSYFRDERGAIIGTLSAGDDITERRSAELALRESEERFRAIFDHSVIGIVMTDTAGRLLVTNGFFQAMLGYSAQELSGKLFTEFTHPEDAVADLAMQQQVVAGKRSHYRIEKRYVHKSGQTIWAHRHVSPIHDADGKVKFIIAVVEDVSKRKLAEERTKKLLVENRRLTQRLFQVQEEERKRISRELHDELGQWLSAVQANAQSMIGAEVENPEKTRESARAIIECVAEAQRGVRHMVSHLRPALLDELGLEDSVHELVAQFRNYHPELECRLSIPQPLGDLGPSIPITAYRVIQEALTNVFRYANARHVDIELARRCETGTDQETLRLSIQDDGCGMPEGASYSGLGLLGMRERVVASGGVYQLYGAKGAGVRIDVDLPIPRQPEEELSE